MSAPLTISVYVVPPFFGDAIRRPRTQLDIRQCGHRDTVPVYALDEHQ